MRKYTWEIVAGVIVAVIVVAVIVSRQSGSSSNTNSLAEKENAVVETDESVNASPEESANENANGNLNNNTIVTPVTNTNASVNTNTTATSFSFTTALTPSQVLSTTPTHKAVLTARPKTVSVRFNAALTEKSSLSIRHEGVEYGTGSLAVDPIKHTLTRALSGQAPRGLYTVNYQGCFDDGVCLSGYFQFGVEPKP